MEIRQNIPLNINSENNIKAANKNFGANILDEKEKNISELSKNDIVGYSQITTNPPVSYTKIGQIPLLGINNPASVFKLSNGQKVVIFPKKGPTYISTSFNVGSFNEPDNLRGISHFIEHSLFNGSKGLKPNEYDEKLTKLGGYTNAFTSYNETQYYLSLQLLEDNSLEEAIKLNANLTQFPSFLSEQIEKEKGAVTSEIDMVADNPSNLAYTTMLKNMFNIKSTSADLCIGTKDNINKLTRETVLDYYNTWYTPDNAVTVITGDVDVDETINLVSKYYNKKLDLNNVQKRGFMPLHSINKPIRQDIKQKTNPETIVSIGFPHKENIKDTDVYKLSVLFDFIASPESKISQKLDKYGICLDFMQENLSSDLAAQGATTTTFSIPEEYTEEVIKIIYDGIIDIINNPPTQEQINNCIKCKINDLKENCQYSADINSILQDIMKHGDLNYYNAKIQAINSLTPQDISNLAKEYLDLNKISVCVAHPDSVSNEEIIQNYNKVNNKSISFGKRLNVIESVKEDTNKIEEYRLLNNMELSVIPLNNSANNQLNISLNTDYNPNLLSPISDILFEMINHGNAFKSNLEFEKGKSSLNLNMIFIPSNGAIDILADFPQENVSGALNLIKETLMNPNFSQDEFERAKELTKNSYKYAEKSPETKIKKELMPNFRESDSIEEQIKQLDKLTLKDVVMYYNNLLYNSQANAVYSGNISQNPYVKNYVINSLSSNLPKFRNFIPDKGKNIHVYKPNLQEKIFTDTEENSQAKVLQSYQYKYTGNINDVAKISLLDQILGAGGMSSRLFIDLRKEQELAYHVKSSTDNDFDIGYMNLYINTSTESETSEPTPENITKSINAFKKNVEQLKTEYVTEEELQMMKNVLKSKILSNLEGNACKTLNAILNKKTYYGKDYTVKFLQAIDDVTVEDIKATANYVFANPPLISIVASKNTLNSLNLNN